MERVRTLDCVCTVIPAFHDLLSDCPPNQVRVQRSERQNSDKQSGLTCVCTKKMVQFTKNAYDLTILSEVAARLIL